MNADMVIPTHFPALILGVSLFLFLVVCNLVLWTKINYYEETPLSCIPGPKWAKWTRLWIVRTLASGKAHEVWVNVNRNYGSLARIGPNHLITNDPIVMRRILAVRSKYTRGPWFDSIKIDPDNANIVSERDRKAHGRLRHKLSTSYNNRFVASIEPVIDEQVLDWLRKVDRCWVSAPERLKSFDIGEALGCVTSDSDKYDFLAAVERANIIVQHFSVLLELNSMLYYLSKIPYLGRLLQPNPADQSGVGRILGIIQTIIENRASTLEDHTNDMLGLHLKKGVPKDMVPSELTVALVAGSDTTTTAVQSILLAIILNPRVYKSLKLEIRIAVTQGLVSLPIQDAEARQLPYLHACIFEGLRKFPPLSQLRERMVPPEGDTIDGFQVPGGTFIGLNLWGCQLDGVFGDDPEAYRPERWLTSDTARLKAMCQTHELIFGHGSTKCLGMPIAMMEMYKMIFELLRHFDIEIADPYKPWSSVCYGIFYRKDFNVHLTRAVTGVAYDPSGTTPLDST